MRKKETESGRTGRLVEQTKAHILVGLLLLWGAVSTGFNAAAGRQAESLPSSFSSFLPPSAAPSAGAAAPPPAGAAGPAEPMLVRSSLMSLPSRAWVQRVSNCASCEA